MAGVSVIITVDGAANLDTVKAECERVGLADIKVLPRVGLLTGVIDAASMCELTKVPGLRAVEPERKISLRPPHPPRR